MLINLSRKDMHASLMMGNDTVAICRALGFTPRKEVMGGLSREEQNVIGFKAEFAVARAFGLHPPVMSIISDYGVDLWWNDIAIDVKSTTKDYLIFDTLKQFKADVAILTSPVEDSAVDIIGWVSRDQFLAEHGTKDFGYGIRCVMHKDELQPISDIKAQLGFPKSTIELNQSIPTA